MSILISGLLAAAIVLQKINSDRKVKTLLTCPAFGCLTRQGAAIVWDGLERRSGKAIIFADLDKMHDLNASLGYAEVDRRIALVCAQLNGQIARWYSGDEFILPCDVRDAKDFAMRMQHLFAEQGIGATWAIAELSGSSLIDAVAIAAEEVQKIKAGR